MDVKVLKKALGAGLLAAAAASNPTAHAATGSVIVDVNFPTVLVMYYYSAIDIAIDQEALGTYLVGSGSNCAGDWCNDQGSAGGPFTINTITGGTATVTPAAVGGPGLTNTTLNIELVDVVGARAIGCGPAGIYDATYDVSGTGITAETGVAVTNLDAAGCSLALTTGTLDFDVDFNALTPGVDNTTATLAVTINGI